MVVIQLHGKETEIDDEMVPVIKELNKLGLKTTSCCSGHDEKKAQLCFDVKDVDVLISKNMVSFNWQRMNEEKIKEK